MGWALKYSHPDDLARALHAAVGGEPVLAPSVTRRLIDTVTALPTTLRAAPPTPGERKLTELLTEREPEVLVLVARGLSNARIASDLGLSEANVKSRVNRILTRLGLDNRARAALIAQRAGLTGTP
ncbi:response regulator transcription factor [Streptomyces sp. 3213.3]|uniref:response regulator transcription factor n=1 Tax=Streptomyces sp. 3213.3 TaxID=1855348 RepID=UPI001F252DB7|nr:response regulator transcription factor [Streptomyces sp. 3213.3]